MKTGCVYNITVGDKGFYIGSSEDFDSRLNTHTTNAKTSNIKLYKAIRDNDGKFVMNKLHDFEYENIVELRIEERRCYDEMKPNLNMRRPYVSEEEMKEYIKKWRIDNTDKINQQSKQRYIDNIDKHKEQMKQWYNDNDDKVKEKQKQSYNKNKETIKEINNKKTTCECGCEFNYSSLKRHQKTKKHLKIMEAKNVNLTTE